MKSFSVQKELDGQRLGKLRLRSGTLETPAMFYGFYPYDPPFWKINGRSTPVVINAYHIWSETSLTRKVRQGMRSYLSSVKVKPHIQKVRQPRDHLGPILFDSGGYSFMHKNRFDISQKNILQLQQDSKTDIAITLDWPIDPNKQSVNERWKRLKLSLENARKALELRVDREMMLMPVVHGWNEGSITYCARSLLGIEMDVGEQFDGFSVGSIVPHFFNRIDKAVKILSIAKRELPHDRPIHILGMGGLGTIPIALALGVDMFDSSTYVLSAIDRWYFVPNFQRIKLSDLKKITCTCPVCRNIKRKSELLHPRKELLSLHNFFILEKECKMLVRSMRKDKLEETISSRLGHNKKLQLICKELIKGDPMSRA